MKKSLLIRWLIILVVIGVWVWALFPMRDGDYLAEFHKRSAKQVAKLKAEAGLLKEDPLAVQQKLVALADKEGAEAKKLQEQIDAIRSDAHFDAWRKYRDYQELEKRLALLQHKADYDAAEAIRKSMAGVKEGEAEYKVLEGQYAAAVAKYADWAKTPEFREFQKRLPVALMREKLNALSNATSAEYKALAAQLAKAEAGLTAPKAGDLEGEANLARLSLVLNSERITSGFRMLEKASNGNAQLYRLTLSDFIHIPLMGKASNKNILRYVRVHSAGKLHLGLDLRGGTEFVLEFDEKEARGLLVNKKACQDFIGEVLADDAKKMVAVSDDLRKKIADAAKAKQAVAGKVSVSDLSLMLANDAVLCNEVKLYLMQNPKFLKQGSVAKDSYGSVTEIRDRVINILENRLNSMGVTEPEIKATGDNTISVRMPSVDEADKNEIRNTIRRAAKLQFCLVARENDELVRQYEADPRGFKTPVGLLRTEMETEQANGAVQYETLFLEAQPTAVKGEDVEKAFPATNEFGQWRISLKFNSAGTVAFRNVTRENVNRRLAIVLDGKVYSAPNIREAIEGGSAEISGSFDLEEAKRLASVIASGNVPVTVYIGSEFGTDPTLGSDSIRSGIKAGIIGLVVVILFMLWYYRVPGFIAVSALVVNTVLVLGTMGLLHATITMPGIAGMVLTMGMAVDANVIIFERIREELMAGSTVGNAITSGYGKAFSAIFDSNITTLFTCLFLYYFGTGTIKGFAATLAFGVLSSMFTAIFMTRTIFETLNELGWIRTLPMRAFKCLLGLNAEILKHRKVTYAISIILLVISIGAFIWRGSAALGIDFAGGTELSYACLGGQPDVEAVRSYLVKQGYSDNVRVGYKRGQSGDPLLEVVLPAKLGATKENKVDYSKFSEDLDKNFPQVKLSLRQTNNVGASVGKQFRASAWTAGLLSLLIIIIYLAFRFEFRYGVAAAAAVLHDCIISVGLFLLMGGNFSLSVVAAVLTILGYSLNDTIVIFDRIRETGELRKSLSGYERINLAVSECMSRTLITTLTTLFVVVVLCCLGGGAIFDFAMVMLFGVIIGTYSSIFIAPAIINTWQKKVEHYRRAAAR